jgi:hypothetical protein
MCYQRFTKQVGLLYDSSVEKYMIMSAHQKLHVYLLFLQNWCKKCFITFPFESFLGQQVVRTDQE